jgi:transcriptional regulator with XRE-family HTH domain
VSQSTLTVSQYDVNRVAEIISGDISGDIANGVFEMSYVGMKFPEKLSFWIEKRGLKQAVIAKKAGLTPSTISDMMTAPKGRKLRRPYLDQGLKLARALELDLDFLADDEADEPPAGLTADEQIVLRYYRSAKRRGVTLEMVEDRLGGLVGPVEEGKVGETGGREAARTISERERKSGFNPESNANVSDVKDIPPVRRKR